MSLEGELGTFLPISLFSLDVDKAHFQIQEVWTSPQILKLSLEK